MTHEGELLKPDGDHHPYCVYRWQIAKRVCMDWKCFCDFLKDYDDWRADYSTATNKTTLDEDAVYNSGYDAGYKDGKLRVTDKGKDGTP